MENKERNMDPDREREEEIRRPSKHKERLTIMIFKKAGKVRTLEISSRLIFFASLFFLICIVAAIFFTNKYLAYFYIYKTDKMQADKIAELSRELIKITKSLERSKQKIAFLNDYVIGEEKDKSPEPMLTVDHTETSLPKIVDIDELKVKRDRSTISINFRIVNRQLNEKPIGGYIFFLASIKDSDSCGVWSYPSSQLKHGLPVDYTKGQRFLIQRFKSIRNKYQLTRSTDKPLILKILVYDRSGELILKKVLEV